MGVNIPPALVALLNKCDDGFVPFAYAVPTRVLRVIATKNFKTFRVEQLVRTNKDNLKPEGTWRTLSTHGSETEAMMLGKAMEALRVAQERLVYKYNKNRPPKLVRA